MKIMLDSIDNCTESYTKPYLDFCAVPIDTKVNRVLEVRFEDGENGENEVEVRSSIEAIIELARDSKVAIIWFQDVGFSNGLMIKKLMKERTYIELDHIFGKNSLCFGQYNFGGILR